MLGYLYLYETLWVIAMRPVPCSSELFVFRASIEHPSAVLGQALWLLSFPSAQQLQRLIPDEPYTKELVYYPFGVAFRWFGYGCLFGWWLQRKTGRKKLKKNEAENRILL
jgi:hypothetical protein